MSKFDFELLAALPKVSLHDHLDGALRPQTIVELADEVGLELPVNSASELANWFETSCDSGVLVDYLKTFDITTGVMQTAEALQRVAYEFAFDLAEDGVIYGEARWAPEQHLNRGLTLDQAVEAVQAGFEEAIAELAKEGYALKVGQLITAMRHADRAMEIAELAVRHRNNGVVGFDIAGAEKGFLPSRHRQAFDFLASKHFPATVHAGESDGPESIASALLDGRALRLGHGVRIAEDIKLSAGSDGDYEYAELGELAVWVRDREIALEVAVSSNLQTEIGQIWGTEVADHPFDLLYQLGFKVTVNPDNRLMSNTSVTKELSRLADAFDYELDDLEFFQLNAASAAFLSLEDREELSEEISDGFASIAAEEDFDDDFEEFDDED